MSDKTATPMDETMPETLVGTPTATKKRVAYALTELVNETNALFPETTHTFSGFNGRGVALEVTFEMAGLDHDEQVTLVALLTSAGADERVSDVTYDQAEELVHVSLWPNARTQDIRDSFNLDDAYSILTEPEDQTGTLSEMVGNYREDDEYMAIHGGSL